MAVESSTRMKFSLSDKVSVGVSECDVFGRANEADFQGGHFCQRAAQPSHSSSKLARCGKMGIFAVHRVGIWAAVKLTENILLMNFYFLMMTSATPCNSALFSMFKCVFFQLEHLYDDYDDDDIA